MMKALKERLSGILKRQDGVALPTVLVMFAVGSLLVVPSINYVATNLKTGTKATAEFQAIISADAGVEDALWKLKNDFPAEFPYSYQLDDINGLTVDVEIDEVGMIAGEPIGPPGTQEDRLIVSSNVTYNAAAGNYDYTLLLTSNHNKPIKIVKMLVDFPPDVEYVTGSTSSNVTKPANADPTTISGSAATGITLIWRNSPPHPTVASYTTEYHLFKLSGPPGMEEALLESNGFVEALSNDVGTVWVGDFPPYSIIARAKDGSGSVLATIRAGVWGGDGVLASISCWQVIP